jgi:hypothetical protein
LSIFLSDLEGRPLRQLLPFLKLRTRHDDVAQLSQTGVDD